MRRLLTPILLVACALGAGSAGATDPTLHVSFGIADDGAKYADDGGGNFFGLMRDVGLDSNRITVTWDPTDGNRGLTIGEKSFLDRAIPVAAIRGIDIVLDVYPLKARAFAVDTPNRITLFAEYLQVLARTYPTVRTFIVGNEPNQPRFNQPQFVRNGRGGYTATAGALYEQVLAAGYDALKAVDPRITVVGLGLSPRGNDNPKAKNNVSRSPVRFVHDLAAAYRASARDRPLMDELGFHPYPNSNNDPLTRGYAWPNAGFPDLDRIKQAFWDGFAGTAQPVFVEPPLFGLPPEPEPGPALGLELDEYGRQATVISSETSEYTGRENVKTVSEAQQAAMYGWVVRRAACDPSVAGFFLFHLIDERDLDRFQSGLLRADGSKRPSYSVVKDTLAATQGECVGAVDVWHHATSVIGADVTFGDAAVTVQADEDVTANAGLFAANASEPRILDALSGRPTARTTASIVVHAYRPRTVALSVHALPPGSYVQAVYLRAVMNPERTFLAVGDPFEVGG
jgi:hypothetical protein